MTESLKARGSRSSWFAVVEEGVLAGERFPCVHTRYRNGDAYHDPWIRPGRRKADDFAAAIMAGRRVIQCRDAVTERPGSEPGFRRKGYVGVYRVDTVSFSESDGLRFRFVEEIAVLR